MQNTIQNFKEYLEKNNASKNTVEAYICDIQNFASYINNDFLNVTKEKINGYIDFLSQQGISVATKNRIISSVRKFYGYLIIVNTAKHNPADDIKVHKTASREPEILTKNEIVEFLSLPKGNTLKSKRDKIILEFMYSTGVKVSEMIGIKLSDININLGLLTVGGDEKSRIIPLYDNLLNSLNDYISKIRPSLNKTGSDNLFLNMNGSKLSRQGVWKIINFYSERFDNTKTVTPNTLRHSFATHLIENGAEIKYVKEILGFEENSSTDFYINLIKSRRKDVYAKYYK